MPVLPTFVEPVHTKWPPGSKHEFYNHNSSYFSSLKTDLCWILHYSKYLIIQIFRGFSQTTIKCSYNLTSILPSRKTQEFSKSILLSLCPTIIRTTSFNLYLTLWINLFEYFKKINLPRKTIKTDKVLKCSNYWNSC